MPKPTPLLLRSALFSAGIHQRVFAHRAGVSLHWVNRVVNGHEPPSERFRLVLAEMFPDLDAPAIEELLSPAPVLEPVGS